MKVRCFLLVLSAILFSILVVVDGKTDDEAASAVVSAANIRKLQRKNLHIGSFLDNKDALSSFGSSYKKKPNAAKKSKKKKRVKKKNRQHKKSKRKRKGGKRKKRIKKNRKRNIKRPKTRSKKLISKRYYGNTLAQFAGSSTLCPKGQSYRSGKCRCSYMADWNSKSRKCQCVYGTYKDRNGYCRMF